MKVRAVQMLVLAALTLTACRGHGETHDAAADAAPTLEDYAAAAKARKAAATAQAAENARKLGNMGAMFQPRGPSPDQLRDQLAQLRTTASAEEQHVLDELAHLLDDPTGDPSTRMRKLVDLMRTLADGHPGDVALEEQFVVTLVRASAYRAGSGAALAAWKAEAVRRAELLAKRNPKEALAQALYGAALDASGADRLAVLRAYRACLRVEPGRAACQTQATALTGELTAARCAGKNIKAALRVFAASATDGGESITTGDAIAPTIHLGKQLVAPADLVAVIEASHDETELDADGHPLATRHVQTVALKLAPAARAALATATSAAGDYEHWLVVRDGDKTLISARIGETLTDGLNLSRFGLGTFCSAVEHPELPADLR